MLTPQEASSKEFVKAVFGGYDMSAVDEFLEQLNNDYAALYSENGKLKGKLKVLVEKVEEYRTTEDSMRLALLTAQKMSDEMTSNAKKEAEEILSDAQKRRDEMLSDAEKRSSEMIGDAEKRSAEMLSEAEKNREELINETRRKTADAYETISKRMADNEARITAAEESTRKFIAASKALVDQQAAFLADIGSIEAPGHLIHAEKTAEPDPDPETSVAEEPETAEAEPETVPEAEAEPGPAEEETAPVAEPEPEIDEHEAEIVETAKSIDSAVSALLDGSAPKTQTVMRTRTSSSTWSDDDEPTSPRPKFAFENLRFGSNYSNED